MVTDDLEKVKVILEEAGDGAPDLISEDQTSDCLWNCLPNEQSPLHTAVVRGKNEIAEVMIQYGGDVNEAGMWGQTSLHQAAKWNNLEGFKMLLTYGANINARDMDGRTTTHMAAMSKSAETKQNTDCLSYVLETFGTKDINTQDNYGRTPLHDAARLGNYLAVCLLVSKGADVKIHNNRGNTALAEAQLFTNKPQIIEYLAQQEQSSTPES